MSESDAQVELTKGAVKYMMMGERLFEPVVQVLGFCYCHFMKSGPIYKCTRRCIRLSDGENFAHAFLASDFVENERNPPEIEDNWIIKLIAFNVNHVVNERRILLIHEALVLQDTTTARCIGHPVSHYPVPELRWYFEDEQDDFFAKVDLMCELQETVQARQVPTPRAIMDVTRNVTITDNQRKHMKDGRESLEDSIAYFKTQYNPAEFITPYMALSIEDGRNIITAGTIEMCFTANQFERPRFIQVVDFRLTTDSKNEEYIHLFINDGVQMTTAILCPFHLNSIYGRRKKLKKFSLIQIQEYSCMTITKFRKCIVFHEIGEIKESECIIRLTKDYPEYCEDSQYKTDPLLQNITNFCELMEREGVNVYGERSEKRSEPPKPFKVKKMKQATNDRFNLPHPEKVISVGSVEKLAHAQDVKNPILQILLFKKIVNQGSERYSLLLSDGYDIMTAMVDPELMKETPKANFQPFTVVQILKYTYLKILRNRNTLMLHKLGYHIPVTTETKKAIGKPVYYTCDIEHPPEDLRKIPRVTPFQTVEMIHSQRRQKRLLQEQVQFSPVIRSPGGITIQTGPNLSEALPDVTNLSPIHSANGRVPALHGFVKYADKWHDKITNTTRLPDGRLIVRRPIQQRVPYQVTTIPEIPKKLQGKVVMRR